MQQVSNVGRLTVPYYNPNQKFIDEDDYEI